MSILWGLFETFLDFLSIFVEPQCKGVILSVVSWKIIRPASLAMRQTVPAIH